MGVPGRPQEAGQAVDRVRAIDLGATYSDLRGEIDAAIGCVLSSGQYIGGPEVEGFEKEVAAFCGVPHAGGLFSGTDALRVTIMEGWGGGWGGGVRATCKRRGGSRAGARR